jgi:hypothetical protein
MSRIRGHLTYANVMATAAVFIALGGTSYAAVKLANNSVKSRHIANGQVKRADLARNAVDSSKVADGSLTKGDLAAPLDADRLGGLTAGAFQRRGTATACAVGQKVTGIGATGNVTCAADAVGTPSTDAQTLDGLDSTEFVKGGGESIVQTLDISGVAVGASIGQDFLQRDGLRVMMTCLNQHTFGTGAQPDVMSAGAMELWIDPTSGNPLYGTLANQEYASVKFGVNFIDDEPQRMLYQGVVNGKAFTAIVTTAQIDPGHCRGTARIFFGP